MKRASSPPNTVSNDFSFNFLDSEAKFTKDVKCVYLILKKENNIPSKRVIELAFSQNGNDYCTGCASADNIIRALKKLQELGLIACDFKADGYHWMLLED